MNGPRVTTNGQSTALTHAELAFSVKTGSAFKIQDFNLLPSGFPAWLDGEASGFSQWRWKELHVTYRTSCATTTPGSFMMGFNYDFLDIQPADLSSFSTMDKYMIGPVWTQAMTIKLDVNRFEKKWYPYVTRDQFSKEFAANPGLCNQFCPARLVFAVSDGPATDIAAGNVFIRYKIELIHPCNRQVDSTKSLSQKVDNLSETVQNLSV